MNGHITIGNEINVSFTLEWLFSIMAFGAVLIAIYICWRVWKETR